MKGNIKIDTDTIQRIKENCQKKCMLRDATGKCILPMACTQVNLTICIALRNAYFKGYYDSRYNSINNNIKEGN